MSVLDNIVRSKAYKNFMAKLYGIGAAVVIFGALFKIMHWPGANLMLILGMTTETIIFFLSAFEPPHKEWDWSLVYPELAGMVDENAIEFDENGNPIEKPVSKDPLSAKLDKMLEDANISPELIDRLGQGMKNLAETTNAMNNMANVTAATDKFISNLDNVAGQAGRLLESMQGAPEAISTLSSIYRETAESLGGEVSYVDEMKKMSNSLSSINAMYEMQINNASAQMNLNKEFEEKMSAMLANFTDSAEGIVKYKEQVDALTRKVAELNNVYGNMLAAMQTRL
ncbi:MAG: gliding motility protein GldL [Bacteroidales bacterium]|nr:gliding motility protein GldL [Bacteroidales bacterium]MBR5092549.1 gliding motility protein GldL [Bacteroidales bacterium]